MTVLNNAGQLERFFESFLAQTYPVREIEFVVTDGGSTDGTQEVVRRYAEVLPNLRLVEAPGCSISRGRNLAIERTTGEFILTFNSDVRLERDCVQELLRVIEEHPEAGGVAAMQVFPESQGYLARCIYFIPGMAQVSLVTTPELRKRDLVETHSVPCECGVWRREALPEGLFDERVRWGEDSEFHFRMMRAGWKIYGTRRAKFEHFYKGSLGKFWKQQVEYGCGAGIMFRLGKEIGWGFGWKKWVALAAPFAFAGWVAATLVWPLVGAALLIAAMSPLLLVSVRAARMGGVRYFPGVLFAQIVKYVANVVGFWKGFLRRSR